MQRRYFLLVSFLGCLWVSKALADDARICKEVIALQEAQMRLHAANQQVDHAATKQLMVSLSQQIKRVRDLNVPAGVVRPSDALSMISSALDRASAQSGPEARLAADLSSLRTDLDLLTIVFGCEFIATTEVAGNDTKPLAIRHLPDEEQAGEKGQTLKNPIVLSGGALGFLALLAAVLARLGLRGRAKREMCNTPVLVSVKNGCTKTRIVDINRNGMKIEAAPIHKQDACVDLYFCGHMRRGKIRWKNGYFAGILFQKRIPQAAVLDVVERSQSSMKNSGLVGNAPPCYHDDCHHSCSKYCASAMSERMEKVQDLTDKAQ